MRRTEARRRLRCSTLLLYSATPTLIESSVPPKNMDAVRNKSRPPGILFPPTPPGFRFTLISRYVFGAGNYAAFLTCWGIPTFNYRMPQRQRAFTRSVASTAARDCIEIGRSHFFSGGVFSVPRLWGAAVVQKESKLRRHKMRQKSNPQLNVCTSLKDSYITPSLIAHHSSPITHHSSLITHHSLLIAHHSSLITHH